jgi:predicted transcriptional regulator
MSKRLPLDVSRRERQIVEAIYRLGEASVADVLGAIPDPPTYSAVRAILATLVEKGILKTRQKGKRYLYRPAASRDSVRRSALSRLLDNFFAGEPTDAVAALLDLSAKSLTPDDLDRMQSLIDQARKEIRE